MFINISLVILVSVAAHKKALPLVGVGGVRKKGVCFFFLFFLFRYAERAAAGTRLEFFVNMVAP